MSTTHGAALQQDEEVLDSQDHQALPEAQVLPPTQPGAALAQEQASLLQTQAKEIQDMKATMLLLQQQLQATAAAASVPQSTASASTSPPQQQQQPAATQDNDWKTDFEGLSIDWGDMDQEQNNHLKTNKEARTACRSLATASQEKSQEVQPTLPGLHRGQHLHTHS